MIGIIWLSLRLASYFACSQPGNVNAPTKKYDTILYRITHKTRTKSHENMQGSLYFYVKLNFRKSAIKLSVDIKYSIRDLIRDVNYSA